MQAAADRSSLHTAVAIAGGAMFGLSLAYFAFEYLRGFDLPPPSGASTARAVVIDLALFSVFALHHSLFARTGVKALVTRSVPASLERSVYVWVASVIFTAMCAGWQPVPGIAWHIEGGAATLLRLLQLAGAAFTLVAARHLDVLDLAGVRQALGLAPRRASGLDDHGPYGFVRHPIYFAWLLLVWPAPLMNGTRLVFAVVSTVYLVLAIPLEERDLRRHFGSAYDRYAAAVRWRLIPRIW